MKLIIGRKPVLEALKSNQEIDDVYLLHGTKGNILSQIFSQAQKRGVKIHKLSPEKFNRIASDKNSQGIVAIKSDQKYYEIEEILASVKEKANPLLLILDSIQDPRNLGAILRTAEASGVDGVIITKNNSASITETVIKTSAGAAEHLKICRVTNLSNLIKILKDNGFWIYGSSLEGAKNLTEENYNLSMALILGNEEKGIKQKTAENCDFLIKIPMKGKIQSLNVSVAAGILLYEINRQRSVNQN